MITEVVYDSWARPFSAFLKKIQGLRLAVVGHARPDGDCIGSQVALARVMRTLGCDVICLNTDSVPRRLEFLVDDLKFLKPSEYGDRDRLALFTDCADAARAGDKYKNLFPIPFANFDHHLSNIGYAEHNFVDTPSAATCEILAGLFFDAKLNVDAVAAEALYTGILTDTGQFRFNSTSRKTFLLSAELVGLGASPARVGYNLYERESPGRIALLRSFLESMTMECGGRICVGTLPAGIFEQTGATMEDTEGLVDYARSIEGVDIGVLVEERPGAIKASLRSKDPAYRLDQVAAKFSGGGHACAAGLNLKGVSSPVFRENLIKALSERIALVDQEKLSP